MSDAGGHPGQDPLRRPEPLMERVDRQRVGRRWANVVLAVVITGFVVALLAIIFTEGLSAARMPLGILIVIVTAVYVGVFRRPNAQGSAAILGAVPADADALPGTRQAMEEMAIAFGLVTSPALAIIETPALNAFIAGERPETAILGVTRGLAETLSVAEQRGVVAHLLARHAIGRSAISEGDGEFEEQADALAMRTLREPEALLSALERMQAATTTLYADTNGIRVFDGYTFAPWVVMPWNAQLLDQRIARLRSILGAEGVATGRSAPSA